MPLIFLLAFLPLMPMVLESLHFFLYGNAMWSMKWGNEVRAWGAILSPLCLAATYFAARHRFKWLTVFPILIFLVLVMNPIVFGLQGEKMFDEESVDLLGFWTTQWQAWRF